MAEDISSTLETIASQSTQVDQLTKSLNELSAAKNKALKAGDVSALVNLNKMEKSIKKLIATSEQYAQAQEQVQAAQKEGRELTEEELENLDKLNKEYKNSAKVVQDYQKAQVQAHEATRESMEKAKAKAYEYWKTHNLLGQGVSFLTGELMQLAGKLTLTGLAWKALTRHAQAAELRQNILIQSYRGFGKEVEGQKAGLDAQGKKLEDTSDGFFDVAKSASKYSEAMAKAESTAHMMGVSTDAVSESMQKFSRITGSQSPEELGKLTEGAITVSRALGISVPEAVDFVSTRMDKFGGSAASAIVSLNQIRTETENTNKAFGRTVIRGDDVVRTLSDISRQTNMYAIDQRFVGNILRDTVGRLQATGDSYETAQKKAAAFSKAITGEAPEWMQIYAGQDVMQALNKGLTMGKDGVAVLNETLAAEMEAAKPGLAKEVGKILGDKSMGGYSKMRLIQELTRGTTVGMTAMNDQILKIAKNPQGVLLISKQFGVTMNEAAAMVDSAKLMKKEQQDLARLSKAGTAAELMKVAAQDESLRITKEQAEKLYDASMTDKDRAETIKAMRADQKEEDTIKQDVARLKEEADRNQKMTEQSEAAIAKYTEMRTAALAAGDTGTANALDRMIADKKAEISRYEGKEDKAKKGLSTIEDINSELLNQFESYAMNTGGFVKAKLSEISTTLNLLIGAASVGIIRYLMKQTGILERIKDVVSERLAEGYGGEKGEKDTKDSRDKGEKKSRKTKRDKFARSGRSGTKKGSMFTRAAKHLTTYKEGKNDAFVQKHALVFAAGANILSAGMDKLTATFDENGKEIDTVNSKAAKDLKSFSGHAALAGGMLAQMPGKLGKFGGALGALASAWEVGVSIGQGVNKMLDTLGFTGEETAKKLADLAYNSEGTMGKILNWAGGVGQGGLVDTTETGAAANKILTEKLMKKTGMSKDEVSKALEASAKANMSVTQYLEKQGRLPPSSKVTAPVTTINQAAKPNDMETKAAKYGMTPEDIAKITKEASAKNMNVDDYMKSKLNSMQPLTPSKTQAMAKQTTAPGAPMSPATAQALKIPQQAAITSAVEKAVNKADSSKSTTTTDSDSGDNSGTAAFVGGINSDGSVTLKVDNFMGIYGKARAMEKSSKIKGPFK